VPGSASWAPHQAPGRGQRRSDLWYLLSVNLAGNADPAEEARNARDFGATITTKRHLLRLGGGAPFVFPARDSIGKVVRAGNKV